MCEHRFQKYPINNYKLLFRKLPKRGFFLKISVSECYFLFMHVYSNISEWLFPPPTLGVFQMFGRCHRM